MTSEDYQKLMRPWYDEEGAYLSAHAVPPAELQEHDEGQPLETFHGQPLNLESHKHVESAMAASAATLADIQASHERALTQLLLARIYCLTPACFEQLILDVVRHAGFAQARPELARKVGRSGDGGIDGIIDLDDFGLDAVYLQAKRLHPGGMVGASMLRDFVGSLETCRATKGVFVTTGGFTRPALETLKNATRRISLVDGAKLAGLMIRHGIGLRELKTVRFQEVDDHWFQNAERKAHRASV